MPWKCPSCESINGDPVTQCGCGKVWKCPSCSKVEDTNATMECDCGYVLQHVPEIEPGESYNKSVLVGVASVGALMFLFGLVRFNSIESQLVRGLGGSDHESLFLLIAGGLLAASCTIALFKSSLPQGIANESIPPNQSTGQNVENISSSTSVPLSGAIEQLERLALLKDRGALTQEEFEELKEKLLTDRRS